MSQSWTPRDAVQPSKACRRRARDRKIAILRAQRDSMGIMRQLRSRDGGFPDGASLQAIADGDSSCEIFDTSHADLADGNEVISVMAIARPTDDADNIASDLDQITSDDGQEITTAPVCLSEMFEIAFEDDRFDSVARVPLESDDDVAVCAAGAFLGASVASVGSDDLDDEQVCLPSVVPEVVLPEVMPEVSIGETANDFGEKPNQLAFINQALETAVALIAKVDKHSDDFMVLKEIISTGQALRNEISHMSLNSDTFQARATNLSIKLLTLNTSMAGPLREGWNSAKSKEGVEYYWPESDPAAVTWTKPGQEMR